MSKSNSRRTNLDEVLGEWNNIKKEIARLEKKQSKFRQNILEMMEIRDTDVLEGNSLCVTKRNMVRKTISKGCVPPDVWNRYAVKSFYPALYISNRK